MENNKDTEALKRLGITIKQVREEKGLTQDAVAFKLGTTQKQVWRIENGDTNVTYCRLLALAEIFEMELSELVRFDNNIQEESY